VSGSGTLRRRGDGAVPTDLRKVIREVPDFPRPGINFYDVSTLFRDAHAFASAVDRLVERYRAEEIDAIAGIEARGFVVAAAMAYALETGLVLIRKPGKLPWETDAEEYALEYGTDSIEMHRDAVGEGQRVLVVDDVLATGGTAAAAGRLIERRGARLQGFAFLIELSFLGGRAKLEPTGVFSLVQYD
jgi:adenine phosphoribosyltransferase